MNEAEEVSRCTTMLLVGLFKRRFKSPLSRRAIAKAGWPNTSLCSCFSTDNNAASTKSAAVRAPEMTPTMSSTASVCSAAASWSVAVMIIGSTTCRNTGSRGGERGDRGVLSTKVASRRGASRSPMVETRLSSAHKKVRNLVGLVDSRHQSTSSAGAFPARARVKEVRMAWATGSWRGCVLLPVSQCNI